MNHADDSHGARLSLRVDVETVRSIDRLARQTGACSRSAAIRLALTRGLNLLAAEGSSR
jgi:hypothetical protein